MQFSQIFCYVVFPLGIAALAMPGNSTSTSAVSMTSIIPAHTSITTTASKETSGSSIPPIITQTTMSTTTSTAPTSTSSLSLSAPKNSTNGTDSDLTNYTIGCNAGIPYIECYHLYTTFYCNNHGELVTDAPLYGPCGPYACSCFCRYNIC